MRVILQPFRTSQPARHFEATVETPVSITDAARFLHKADLSQLRSAHPDLNAPMWGFAPLPSYKTMWKSLAPGDLIVFFRDGAVFAAGFLAAKWENRALAAHLWGFDARHPDRTWDLMISLRDMTEGACALKEVTDLIGKSVGEDQISAVSTEVSDSVALRTLELLSGFKKFRHYRFLEPFKPIPAMGGELLIFVALDEERRFLSERWKLAAPTGKDLLGHATWGGSIAGICDVRVLCASQSGRMAAMLTLSDFLASSTHDLGLVVSFGLSGGFVDNGVVIGDVIIAEEVVDLGIRKVRDHFLEIRDRSYQVHRGALKVFRVMQDTCGDWLKLGSMACVDEIVASSDHQDLLKASSWRKYMGVDMESSAVLAACQDGRFSIPSIVVRGVSDLADKSKGDESRGQALNNAALAIEIFLRELAVESAKGSGL